MLELELDPAVAGESKELPEHGVRVGDIVGLAEQPKGAERKKERKGMEEKGVNGVVTKVQREGVTVALDKEDVDVPGGKLWLCVSFADCMLVENRSLIYLFLHRVKLANDVTYKRYLYDVPSEDDVILIRSQDEPDDDSSAEDERE